MYEAIKYAKVSQEELEKVMIEEDETAREILSNKAFEHYGYAQGINQVLAELGFKHKKNERTI